MQWLGAGLGLFKEFNLKRTHKLNGLFHFLSAQVYICRNPGNPLIMVFPEVSISRYIFPVGKFAQLPFLGRETEICFQVSFFCKGLNCLRLNSTEFLSQTIIYSRAYWFLKIWLSKALYE